MASVTAEPPVRPLTEREVGVLQRIAAGRTQRSIAAELRISRGTVRDAYENAQRKLRIAREAESSQGGSRLND